MGGEVQSQKNYLLNSSISKAKGTDVGGRKLGSQGLLHLSGG